jgi:uncharacterized membrane-anchored protein
MSDALVAASWQHIMEISQEMSALAEQHEWELLQEKGVERLRIPSFS